MKKFKKLGAFLLVVVMMLSLSVTAFAADGTTTVDTLEAEKASVVSNVETGNFSSITFTVYLNDQQPTGSRPITKFHYQVAPGTANADQGISAGELSYLNLTAANGQTYATQVTDAWDTVNGPASDTITFTFTGIPAHAGIYRYKITQEALSDAQKTVGVKSEGADGSGPVERIFDIYVNSTGKVVAAVLSKAGTFTKSEDGATAAYTDKVDGFHNTYGENKKPNDPDNPTDDEKSGGYNVNVKKNVSGNMGNTDQDFPFTVTITVPTLTGGETSFNGMTVNVKTTNANTVEAFTLTDNGDNKSTEKTFKLKHDETIEFYGLPAGATVKVKETTAKSEGYKISAKGENFNDSVADVGTPSNLANSTVTDNAQIEGVVKDSTTTVGTFNFYNDRASISPTGVVVRFAPYIILMSAGIFFLVLGKRRKEQEEA